MLDVKGEGSGRRRSVKKEKKGTEGPGHSNYHDRRNR